MKHTSLLLVDTLVDKAVALPRHFGYTLWETIGSKRTRTQRHISSGQALPFLLISPRVLVFLSVTVIVFMHLNRRGRYRSGYRSERETRVETQTAAEAVEQLIRAYRRHVFHLSQGKVHDWHESEDLTQEVFLSALGGIDAARAARGAQFQAKAWLLHIAVNRVRMYRRRQRLIQFVPFSQMEPAQADADLISELAAPVQPGGYCTVEGGGDPAYLVAERDAVGRALAGMPDLLRAPLLLSVVGGLPSAEIARILGVGETAVRQRLSRARRQFKVRYAGESGEVVGDPNAPTEHQSATPGTAASVRLTVVPQRVPVSAGL
jgi:RNA polymerase sigma-70 factor (ECF subfamily)